MNRDTSAMPPKRLAFSVREVSEAFDVGQSTIWRWIAAGKLRVTRVGGRTLVPASEVARLAGDPGS